MGNQSNRGCCSSKSDSSVDHASGGKKNKKPRSIKNMTSASEVYSNNRKMTEFHEFKN